MRKLILYQPVFLLPVIVVAQFFCTSVWFASNAVLTDIVRLFNFETGFVATLTTAVQLGFISGTVCFAFLSVADRFPPSRVFLFCAVLAAISNAVIILPAIQPSAILLFRFLTGFFLAGIYPVGMKIASDHYREGLGRSLGFLVGALVLGTALPHLLKALSFQLQWQRVMITTSVLCITGGIAMIVWVGEGPYRKAGQSIKLSSFRIIFHQPELRSAALGYFGHMWELYTFWAFVPAMISLSDKSSSFNIPFISFTVIAIGSVACAVAGWYSVKFTPAKLAKYALAVSGCCCLIFPIAIYSPFPFFYCFLLVWGFSVIADSPLFSTLVAMNAPAELRGSVITIVTSAGFAVTVISIQLTRWMSDRYQSPLVYLVLAIGPLTGLLAMSKKKKAIGMR